MKSSLNYASFIDQYWGMLEEKGWSSLILHDWERIPNGIDSDIDYIVRGPQPRELIHALIDYCEEHGWSLVQILEHEVDAHYCVCVRNESPFESVLLDVCWDYRRKGIDLLDNQTLFQGVRQPPGRRFNVPSPEVEFIYRLIKSAAKGKDLGSLPELEKKMRELFENHPDECMNLLDQVASYEGERDWEGVKAFFEESPYFDRTRSGRKISLRELKLYSKRISRPTGLLLTYEEGHPQISEIVDHLECAFRRVEWVKRGTPIWKIQTSLIKSTLVVKPGSADQRGSGIYLPQGGADSLFHGVRAGMEFLAARIKKQWQYCK